MSRYLSGKLSALEPYVPGEQPKNQKFIKLNTNESPFPPSEKAVSYAARAAENLNLYSDPDNTELIEKVAGYYGLKPEQVIVTNGSDEVLNLAFIAFCDKQRPAVFPDITYGFYPVFANVNCVPYEEIPLNRDFTLNVEDYMGLNKVIFLANPDAPTTLKISLDDIRRIAESNPQGIVVIDEAYVDFGNESAVTLVNDYSNLLVTQTFSKSRSLAGARLGMGFAGREIIEDLNTVKFSTNPYNVNRMTAAAGIGAIEDDAYMKANCKTIIENRAYTQKELRKLGFELPDSNTNFVFARHPAYTGEYIYTRLREKGILVRHFTKPAICDWNRITIGTAYEMEMLIKALKEITEE